MPVSFDILKNHSLVYVRYSGLAEISETFQAFGAYMQHPDFRPGQKQLVDLTHITDYERDFTAIMGAQAKKAEVFLMGATETLIVYLAPNPKSYEMARMICQSWEDVEGVVPIVQQSETDALSLLGLSETSLSELLTDVE